MMPVQEFNNQFATRFAREDLSSVKVFSHIYYERNLANKSNFFNFLLCFVFVSFGLSIS